MKPEFFTRNKEPIRTRLPRITFQTTESISEPHPRLDQDIQVRIVHSQK